MQRRGIRIRSSAPQPGLLWRDWIAAGLAGRAVRALHVVADAIFDVDRPLLAVSDPGQPADRSNCAYVAPDDVRLLADLIGAAALSFGSPPDNSSDIATRVMADAVELQRPGATLYSSMRLDPAGDPLANAYAFIANNEPGLVTRPRDPSLFAYLQPESVKIRCRSPGPTRSRCRALRPRPGPDLNSYYAQADVVPTWVDSNRALHRLQRGAPRQRPRPPKARPPAQGGPTRKVPKRRSQSCERSRPDTWGSHEPNDR